MKADRDGTGHGTGTADGCESEARLRAIVEHGPLGQGMATLDGTILEANPALGAILGRSTEELVGRPFWDFIHSDDRCVAGAALARLLSGETAHTVSEVRFVRPDGSVTHTEVAASAVPDGNGRPQRVVAVIHDTTERRRADVALRDSEERFRLLTVNSADLVTRHAASGRLVWASPASLPVLGYPPADLAAAGAAPLADPRDLGVIEAACRALATGSALESFTLPYRHRNGAMVWLETKAWAVRDQEGRAVELHAVSRDVTIRHQAEEELARRARQQTAVSRLGQFALRAADRHEVLTEACRTASSVLGAPKAGFLQLDPAHRDLLLVAGAGWPEAMVGSFRADAASSHPAFALQAAEPVVVEDFTTETRFQVAPVLLDHGLRSGITVAVTGASGTHGVLGIHSAEPGWFSADAAAFLQSVANVVAAYLDRHCDVERARHAALHDALTGIPNRTLFSDRAEAALGRAARTGASTAVLFLDLDQFKLVNDGLSHAAGDELLVQIAGRLQGALRAGDTVARLGGDEFAVLCENLESPDQARAVAERLEGALSGAFHVHGRVFFTTASIGIAVAGADSPVDVAELLRNADSAMYRAKAAGRARIETFDGAMQREDTQRFELAGELHGALARDELRLHYQPVLRLRDGEIVGSEALLRWQHPTRGLVGPGEFISLAEDTGLIVPIGAWILHEACAAAARWPATADGTPRKASVNISARQLRDGQLVATVAEALERSGLAPSALCLEVTESLLMLDPEHSQRVLGDLKDLGVKLSIDDFGTGYSSLSRLKQFPLDYLKVDRSFVDGLGVVDDDDAIVTAIIRLAHSLGLVVVAEGVEEERQREALRRLRCEAGQGWLWSKALPEAEFVRWLEEHAPATVDLLSTGPAAAGRTRSGASRVLVVDDDPAHLELVRVLLGASGHEVIPVQDPAEFLDTLVRAEPDLVLMDLRMPGSGGFDLVQDMAITGLRPPVLAVSAHPDWAGRPLSGADRFAGVIAKPIDPEAFAAQIDAYLTGIGRPTAAGRGGSGIDHDPVGRDQAEEGVDHLRIEVETPLVA